MGQWTAIDESVFVYDDCCRVYALRDGDRALVIDLGSGEALERVGEIGVQRVEGILFTHAHRDQCQGWRTAVERGVPLRFPAAAESFVAADRRDDFQRLAPGHLAYPHRFHPPQPMPEAVFDLQPQGTIVWGPYNLEVFAAPGHIDHQLAFRVDGPHGSYLFCGDALHSRGKVHEAFCLEHDHYTGGGARLGADTLCALRNLRARHLCPSHGPVTSEGVWDAFCVTIARLRELADLKDTIMPRRPAVERLVRHHRGELMRVSEHLWVWNNSYFLLSDDGPVLMVDVQTKLPEEFHELYRATFGERPIEVVLVSHMHCDHVMGVEDLRRRHPLECWALERIVPSLEQPYEFARPWLHNDPAKVDRPLAEGQSVRWHEYELTAYWFPGQTDQHAVYSLTIDGHRALFAGDNFYPAQQWGGTGGLCGYNGGHPALWRRSAELVMRLEPEWVLSSHVQPYVYRRADFEAVVEWSDRIAALMRDLAPDGNLERHHSPHSCYATPYVQPVWETNPVKLVILNTYPEPMQVEVTPRLPDGLGGDAAMRTATVDPGRTIGLGFNFTAEPALKGMRMVTFDLRVNGEPWGELVECYLRGQGDYVGQE